MEIFPATLMLDFLFIGWIAADASVSTKYAEVIPVSIVRIGLAETKNFSEGYEAIFGKKKPKKGKPEGARKKRAKAGKKRKT
jgi:hypothetical protein